VAQISSLPAYVIDKLTFRSSQRVDSYTNRRLQAPGSTTLLDVAHAGDTAITVNSTLTLDSLAEQAVIIDTGGLQETIIVQPGGVTVTSYASPYPGTIALASPCAFGHAINAPVTFVYKEVWEAGNASSADPYTEALQSQAAQLALAHLPMRHAGLDRIAFTKQYPIISVLAIEHSYSFDNVYNAIDTSGISIEPTAGWLRYKVGQVIIPEGLTRTTYTGGFQVVPDDVKLATLYYLADELQVYFNAAGGLSIQQGKRNTRFSDGKSRPYWVQRAQEVLDDGHYKKRWI